MTPPVVSIPRVKGLTSMSTMIRLYLVLARQDTTLDGGAVGDSLVGVDDLAGLLAAEELLDAASGPWDTGGSTDENNVVDLGLLELGILENLLDRLEGLREEVHVELLELGAGEGLGEVLAVEEGLDFDATSTSGEDRVRLAFSGLALELTHGLGVRGDVDVVLPC